MRRSGFRRRNKFKAIKTKVDDILFDSKLEAGWYVNLKYQEKLGLIKDLETQVEIPLIVNDILICNIIPDFKFKKVLSSGEKETIGEAKGLPTPEWRIKWKLLQALHPEYDYELFTNKAKTWR